MLVQGVDSRIRWTYHFVLVYLVIYTTTISSWLTDLCVIRQTGYLGQNRCLCSKYEVLCTCYIHDNHFINSYQCLALTDTGKVLALIFNMEVNTVPVKGGTEAERSE